METLLPLIIQIGSGLTCSYLAALMFRKFSIGIAGNTLAGLVGGALGGYIFSDMLISGMVGDILSGGAGGAGFMLFTGIMRKVSGNS